MKADSGKPKPSYELGEAMADCIWGLWADEGDHLVAHFDAHRGGRRASVSVDGTVLAGELGARELGLVRNWAQLHWAELLTNWDRARNAEILLPVEPLP